MMLLQVTALLTMFWIFMVAMYIRPSYQRIRARNGR